MFSPRRRSSVDVVALVGIAVIAGALLVTGADPARAQGGNDDDEFNLLGQFGNARIVSPEDGEVVDWPLTIVIQADEPGLVWDNLGYMGPGSSDIETFEFDASGRAELTFDGAFPQWALEENWTARYFEAFGSWTKPGTGESGNFSDDTIVRINTPVAAAPVITFDPIDGPVTLPTTVTGQVDSEFEVDDLVLEHDGQIQSEVTLGADGSFSIALIGPYRQRIEPFDDRVISLLVKAVDVSGARGLASIDLQTSAPALTLDPFVQPAEYPIRLSGTYAHDGITEFPNITLELDWDYRQVVYYQDVVLHDDGTWTLEFDPRFVEGWVYETGDVLGLSFRFRDHAGRSAAVHAQVVMPPQFLYCAGFGVTVDLLKGDVPTDGDDVILGGPVRDIIDAGAGDDVICALGGWDIIDGGPGHDVIVAGNGRDRIIGGLGDDTIFGGGGADDISAGRGDDEVSGGRGNDVIRLGADHDLAVGNEGNDQIFGGTGSDELYGRLGLDRLDGGLGNDLLVGGVGPDNIFGGGGNDRAFGEAGRDRIDLGNGRDLALGGPGDDVIFGQQGDDRMGGDEGNDTIIGGTGRDYALGGDGVDVCQTELREECER